MLLESTIIIVCCVALSCARAVSLSPFVYLVVHQWHLALRSPQPQVRWQGRRRARWSLCVVGHLFLFMLLGRGGTPPQPSAPHSKSLHSASGTVIWITQGWDRSQEMKI